MYVRVAKVHIYLTKVAEEKDRVSASKNHSLCMTTSILMCKPILLQIFLMVKGEGRQSTGFFKMLQRRVS